VYSSHKESIICPNCHRTFKTDIIDLIEFSKDLDLIPKFLKGDIHKVKCPHCKFNLKLERAVLIIVDPESFMIWAIPPSLKDKYREEKVQQLIELVGNYTPLLKESLSEFKLELSVGFENTINKIKNYVSMNKKRFPEDVLKIINI